MKKQSVSICVIAFSICFELSAKQPALGEEGCSATSAPAFAQPLTSPAPLQSPKLFTNYIETGSAYFGLTNNYGHWASGYSRMVYQHQDDILNAEINGQQEFGDSGVYYSVGDTHTFGSRWYGSLALGSSVGGFFWPKWRADTFLNKKWLARKQWVTSIGYGYFRAKDLHRNQSVFIGDTYYLDKPWILEEGIYLNVSDPGKVFSPSGFVAITQGINKHHYITVRLGIGEEAYQLIGPNAALTKFESDSVSVTWRKWITPSWGFNMVGDFYRNPSYQRLGSSVGVFKEF